MHFVSISIRNKLSIFKIFMMRLKFWNLYLNLLKVNVWFSLLRILAEGCSDPTLSLTNQSQIYEFGPSAPSNFSDGAFYTILCILGFYWPDGSVTKSIVCTEYKWNGNLPPCTGNSNS